MVNTGGIIKIRSEQIFQVRLKASDYEIYRDGFCLLIKTTRSRQAYQIRHNQLIEMIMAMGNFPRVPDHIIEAVLTAEQPLTIWKLPTDEMIIQYCIDRALIPHPYEEYG